MIPQCRYMKQIRQRLRFNVTGIFIHISSIYGVLKMHLGLLEVKQEEFIT